MVWFSYHGGHSGRFCRHARGELRQVVERAVERGFSHYGLSEHCPRSRREDLYPDEADLSPAELEQMFAAYVAEARALQLEFAPRLSILVGLETEALPPGAWSSEMQALRAKYQLDYIVGSVHSVDSIPIDFTPERALEAEARCGGWDPLCRAYFDQVTELVSTLQPEVTGHLDLIRRFRGESVEFSEDVWPSIEAALRAVQRVDSAIEVNAAPVRRGFGPVYPAPRILERARQLGVKLTLGDDSHGPDDVGGGLDACVRAIANAGFDSVYALERGEGRATPRAVALRDVFAA